MMTRTSSNIGELKPLWIDGISCL